MIILARRYDIFFIRAFEQRIYNSKGYVPENMEIFILNQFHPRISHHHPRGHEYSLPY